jgi:hypothetical protein
MKNFKEQLIKKLKTCNYSIGLGNFAYTPVSEELTEWLGSDQKPIEATIDELFKDYTDLWFKEEINNCLESGDFKSILFKSNPTQEEWEEHFVNVVSK